jgi:hypothetical protein
MSDPLLVKWCVVIRTKYQGPTEHRGSRITVAIYGNGKPFRMTFSYRAELDPSENHVAAATEALDANDMMTHGRVLCGMQVRPGEFFFSVPFLKDLPWIKPHPAGA